MRRAGGIIITTAKDHQVPAGSALAVDREGFSEAVTAKLEAHPLVTIVREEITGIPPEDWDSVIVATGPLTSIALAEAIRAHTGETDLAFFDAIAPIVYFDSIDMDKAWRQSRYDKAGHVIGDTVKSIIFTVRGHAPVSAPPDAPVPAARPKLPVSASSWK